MSAVPDSTPSLVATGIAGFDDIIGGGFTSDRLDACLKKSSDADEDSLREFRLTSGGSWLGEPLVHFQSVLAGTPPIVRA